MKKLITISITACILLAAFNACKKTGGAINPLADVNNLGIGSYLVLDSTISANLNTSNATSKVGIIAHQYPGSEDITKVNVYTVNGTSTDTTLWKLVKAVPYTSPNTQLTVTTAELGTALGINPSTIPPGTLYTFYLRIVTKSGKTYDVNNTGDNGGGGLVTGPAYKNATSFSAYVVCPFTGNMTGNYKVVRDDWADWSPGQIVAITDGPGANQVNLSKVYPGGGTIVSPLIATVDPATGAASVPKTTYGYYSSASVQYSASGSGYIFSCTGYITLSLTHTDNTGGNYGAQTLILQKQ